MVLHGVLWNQAWNLTKRRDFRIAGWTGTAPERHHLRGEARKSEMIWPICLASSGGTALPI